MPDAIKDVINNKINLGEYNIIMEDKKSQNSVSKENGDAQKQVKTKKKTSAIYNFFGLQKTKDGESKTTFPFFWV